MVSTCLNKRLLQPDSHLCMALNTESLLHETCCHSFTAFSDLRSLEPGFRRTAKGSYGPWKKKASQHRNIPSMLQDAASIRTFSLGKAPFSASPQERCKLSKSEQPVRKCSKMFESTRGLHIVEDSKIGIPLFLETIQCCAFASCSLVTAVLYRLSKTVNTTNINKHYSMRWIAR